MPPTMAPGMRAHAAEDDDHEGLRDHEVAHGGIDEVDGSEERCRDGRQCARDGESQHRYLGGVDSDERGTLAVLRHRDDGGPDHGAGEKEVQQHHQPESRRDDDEALRGRDQVEDPDDLRIGRLETVELRAPDGLDHGLQKQQQADRRDHVVQRRCVAELVEDQTVRKHRQNRDGRRRPCHGGPVVQPGRARQVEGHVGPHHVERAVREIRDVQNAVDEREPERHEGIDAAERQPVQDLLKEDVQRAASSGTRGPETGRPRDCP